MSSRSTLPVGVPGNGVCNASLVQALRIIRMYGERVPTWRQIANDFEVSRATAYRWRNALVESQRTEA